MTSLSNSSYLALYFKALAACLIFALLILAPWLFFWLYSSGDLAVERAAQAQAKGDFIIFGSGVSQDFMDYKLQLYKAKQPLVIALGSSRVMQFRGSWFNKPFLNMGGVAGNLAELRTAVNEIIKIGPPQAVILGIDFWWFMPQWEKEPFKELPPSSGSYNYGLNALKSPLVWLMEGKISVAEFFAPVLGSFGQGFRPDRLGIMAQQTSDGFGPDGSWTYTGELTGQKKPQDFQFQDTLEQVQRGIKAFYHAAGKPGPAQTHIDAFMDILSLLKDSGAAVYVFMPPVAQRVLAAMHDRQSHYPHLFNLREALQKKGVDVFELTDPSEIASNECEFVDGFHGGEITYARILLGLAGRWPKLAEYVKMDFLKKHIEEWRGHAMSFNPEITNLPETDFMRLGCPKKTSTL